MSKKRKREKNNLNNHLICNIKFPKIITTQSSNTEFFSKDEILEFLEEKILKLSISEDKKKEVLGKLLKTYQNKRSTRILKENKFSYYTIQNRLKKGDGTLNARDHFIIVISDKNYVEKIIESEYDGGLGIKIIEKFLNEIISQVFAGLISKNVIRIPEIINWGICESENRECIYIRMSKVSGKEISKLNLNQKQTDYIIDSITKFSKKAFDNYYFHHGDIHKNNIIFDAKNNIIWLIDWGEAIFMKGPGFIKRKLSI